MNQRTKNISLLTLLGLLVMSSIILALTGHRGTINTMENKEMFSIEDTSKVDQIKIISQKGIIQLKENDGAWILNDQYKAEQNIVKVLLSILKDVQVVRNVPTSQKKNVIDQLKDTGQLVEIITKGNIIKSFYCSGNDTKTVSYMMPLKEENPMIVNIPGYESYVAGIFEISTNDWRDRVILRTNWRTLQNLAIKYTEYPEYNLTIKFDFNFLKVEGVSNLDTARMMAFVDEFNYLQADRYLDKGENESYDSLLTTPITVTISIEDIKADNSKTIDFYPLLPDDPMMLAYIREDEQMVLFEARRIQDLFAVKSDFVANSRENSE